MKILFAFLAVMACAAVCGQITPMVSECNSWYHTRHYDGWLGGPNSNNHHTYFFNGDTLVGDITYKKLYMDRRDTTFYAEPSIIHSVTLKRLMRQEGDTVFHKHLGLEGEFIYAVFNLDVADTLSYYPHDVDWPNQPLTIESVDSVLLGSEYLRKYELSNSYFFVETIGGSHGILKNFALGIEGGIYMDCFIRNGQSLGISFLGPNYYPCDATVYGCLDEEACNFNAWAEADNGNCIYGPCPDGFDINNDGSIATEDLLALIAEFGCIGSACESDFNYDGVVNVEDLLLLIQAFGSSSC